MSTIIYMRIIITAAIVIFFIGIYKNLIRKIIYILQIQESERDHEPRKIVSVIRLAFKEAVIQRRIKKRSTILWIRHLMIFGGFFTFFLIEFFIGIMKGYQSFNFIMPAVKIGLDLSGAVLILGLIIALVHWVIYREEEQNLIDIKSVILLVAVVISGLMSVACRTLLSPEISYMVTPVGYAIVKFSESVGYSLEEIHHWLYLFHITMAAAVIAYIPFCKLIHILAVPIGRIATMGEGYVAQKRIKVTEDLL